MWLINLPIALILVGVSPLLQESARFLQSMGRHEEARDTLARFGILLDVGSSSRTEVTAAPASLGLRDLAGITCALTLTALAWGLVNFGIMLWLPGRLMAEGRSMGVASALIARSTLIAAPTIVIAAYLYSVWNTKRVLAFFLGLTSLGLIAVVMHEAGGVPLLANPLIALSLLILGSSGVISILLPYTAESYPLRIRGRATGWVAGFSKAGGLMAQGLGALSMVPALGMAAGGVACLSVISIALVLRLGRDTAGHDLL